LRVIDSSDIAVMQTCEMEETQAALLTPIAFFFSNSMW